MKQIKFISIKSLMSDKPREESMISLDNPFELSALFKEYGNRLIVSCFPDTVKLNHRSRQLNNFGNHLLSLKRRHGATYVVHYLKCSQLAVQKGISKDQINSLRELNPSFPFPRLSRSNLPKIIPLSDRRSIMSGCPSIIRWWLTLFSLYRVIKIPGQLKLSTITDPYQGDKTFLSELCNILPGFSQRVLKDLIKGDIVPGRTLYLEKASPSSSSS